MYHEGDIVLVHGLKSKPEWNGKKAKVIGEFQWQQARYPIQIIENTDQDLSALLKPINLKVKILIHSFLQFIKIDF